MNALQGNRSNEEEKFKSVFVTQSQLRIKCGKRKDDRAGVLENPS